MSAIESAFVNSVLGDEREKDRGVERTLVTVTKVRKTTAGSKDAGENYAPRETMVRRISGFRIWRKNSAGAELPTSISVDRVSTKTSSAPASQAQTPIHSPRAQSPSR